MFNRRFLGLLLIPACLGTINTSFALSDTASQTLEAVLNAFVDIQAEESGAIKKAIINPDNGNLDKSLVSKFTMKANAEAPEIYLKGTTASSTNLNETALFENGGKVYLVLSNINEKPLSASVENCKSQSPASANNANSIAYPISNIQISNSGNVTYDNNSSRYNVTAKTGQTSLAATIGTQALSNTYSFEDQAGSYQATLTLTTSAL